MAFEVQHFFSELKSEGYESTKRLCVYIKWCGLRMFKVSDIRKLDRDTRINWHFARSGNYQRLLCQQN